MGSTWLIIVVHFLISNTFLIQSNVLLAWWNNQQRHDRNIQDSTEQHWCVPLDVWRGFWVNVHSLTICTTSISNHINSRWKSRTSVTSTQTRSEVTSKSDTKKKVSKLWYFNDELRRISKGVSLTSALRRPRLTSPPQTTISDMATLVKWITADLFFRKPSWLLMRNTVAVTDYFLQRFIWNENDLR